LTVKKRPGLNVDHLSECWVQEWLDLYLWSPTSCHGVQRDVILDCVFFFRLSD